jgi:Protein of unknown function (DUF4238)
MSGVNEHYIPRLLQRGFLTKSPGIKTFCHDKFRSKEVSIRKLASADYFYSIVDGNKEVDDKLTNFENSIGNDIKYWRESSGCEVNSEIAANVVTLLHIRTKNIRQTLDNSINIMISCIIKEFLNPSRVNKRLNKEIKNHNSEFRRRVRGELAILNIFGSSAVSLEEIAVEEALRRSETVSSNFVHMLPTFVEAMTRGAADAPHDKRLQR